MISFSKTLSIVVIILAVAAVLTLAYTQFNVMRESYNSQIRVSFVKSPSAFDYSCGTSDYQIYFQVDNIGAKNVTDLKVSITNPLCATGVPSNLPRNLNPNSTLSFVAESSTKNGTLTISGNNTFVQINF